MNSTTPFSDISTIELSKRFDLKSQPNIQTLIEPSRKLSLSRQSTIDALYSTYHSFIVSPESPISLFSLLHSHLPTIDPDTWKIRAEIGGLHLNGKCIEEDIEIDQRHRIEYYEPKYSINESESFFPLITEENIIYQDEHLAILFKPAGIPTITSREQNKFSLKESCKILFHENIHFPSRLDASTSGLVVCSLQKDFHNKLQKLYETREIHKYYLLSTQDSPQWSFATINIPIGKGDVHPVLRTPFGEDSKDATTHLCVIHTDKKRTLICAKPVTGRTHQIRIHTACSVGSIDGDRFYGGRKEEELHLLSYQVTFKHPATENIVSCKLPKRWLPSWLFDQKAS